MMGDLMVSAGALGKFVSRQCHFEFVEDGFDIEAYVKANVASACIKKPLVHGVPLILSRHQTAMTREDDDVVVVCDGYVVLTEDGPHPIDISMLNVRFLLAAGRGGRYAVALRDRDVVLVRTLCALYDILVDPVLIAMYPVLMPLAHTMSIHIARLAELYGQAVSPPNTIKRVLGAIGLLQVVSYDETNKTGVHARLHQYNAHVSHFFNQLPTLLTENAVARLYYLADTRDYSADSVALFDTVCSTLLQDICATGCIRGHGGTHSPPARITVNITSGGVSFSAPGIPSRWTVTTAQARELHPQHSPAMDVLFEVAIEMACNWQLLGRIEQAEARTTLSESCFVSVVHLLDVVSYVRAGSVVRSISWRSRPLTVVGVAIAVFVIATERACGDMALVNRRLVSDVARRMFPRIVDTMALYLASPAVKLEFGDTVYGFDLINDRDAQCAIYSTHVHWLATRPTQGTLVCYDRDNTPRKIHRVFSVRGAQCTEIRPSTLMAVTYAVACIIYSRIYVVLDKAPFTQSAQLTPLNQCMGGCAGITPHSAVPTFLLGAVRLIQRIVSVPFATLTFVHVEPGSLATVHMLGTYYGDATKGVPIKFTDDTLVIDKKEYALGNDATSCIPELSDDVEDVDLVLSGTMQSEQMQSVITSTGDVVLWAEPSMLMLLNPVPPKFSDQSDKQPDMLSVAFRDMLRHIATIPISDKLDAVAHYGAEEGVLNVVINTATLSASFRPIFEMATGRKVEPNARVTLLWTSNGTIRIGYTSVNSNDGVELRTALDQIPSAAKGLSRDGIELACVPITTADARRIGYGWIARKDYTSKHSYTLAPLEKGDGPLMLVDNGNNRVPCALLLLQVAGAIDTYKPGFARTRAELRGIDARPVAIPAWKPYAVELHNPVLPPVMRRFALGLLPLPAGVWWNDLDI
jgi:hypothetical protein